MLIGSDTIWQFVLFNKWTFAAASIHNTLAPKLRPKIQQKYDTGFDAQHVWYSQLQKYPTSKARSFCLEVQHTFVPIFYLGCVASVHTRLLSCVVQAGLFWGTLFRICESILCLYLHTISVLCIIYLCTFIFISPSCICILLQYDFYLSFWFFKIILRIRWIVNCGKHQIKQLFRCRYMISSPSHLEWTSSIS